MNATLTRDLLLNMLLGLVGVVLILLTAPAARPDDVAKQPGSMIVSAAWPLGDTDIDLWVRGPGEAKAVGYSNRGGTLFNLLRDDLGTAMDKLPLNYENAYNRGLPAGEYTVNVHLYRGKGPVPVSIEIRFGENSKLYLAETIDLKAHGQERTVISFRLDGKGNVTGSNRVFKPLRVAKEGGV